METLDPKVAKEISESASGKALIKHLAEAVMSLDSIGDIELDDPNEIAVEVKGRKRAAEKLQQVLTGLLVPTTQTTIKDERDSFAVEVDPPEKKGN